MSEHEDPISLLIRHKYLLWKQQYIYCWSPDAEDILDSYRKLEPLIRESLETSVEETHDWISFNCYMLGNVKEKSRAGAHIVFACGNVKVAREAQRITVSSGLLKKALTPFGTDIMPQLPFRRLFKLGGANSDFSQFEVKDVSFLPESQGETMNWVEDDHIGRFLYQPPWSSIGAHIMATYSKYASSRYISPWHGSGMLVEMYNRWVAPAAFESILTFPWREYSKKIPMPEPQRYLYEHGPPGHIKCFSSEYDWALITLDDGHSNQSIQAKISIGQNPVGTIDSDNTLHRRAIALTIDEDIPGSILPGAILEQPPGGKLFHRLFHFRIDGEAELIHREGFMTGDCGSPVVDAETGQLYGHVVYGCQDERSAFVISASEAMDSITGFGEVDYNDGN
ncbi:hypothetical protein GRF29_161g116878 [Pseudopithomyces chartarum]|uniref:Uncharacterized protein n=1 Tax=Pseudopithomyces chartarum TaxID=1892770 RepID=A0AAN6LS52_9PLEO|nr:hypothetical protein GRF29_161g116878 [Pseudopithomyces chartarum]